MIQSNSEEPILHEATYSISCPFTIKQSNSFIFPLQLDFPLKGLR